MKKLSLIIIAIGVTCCFSTAKITTPKVISDNMVLQRNEPVNIWGKSDANAEVSVKFGDITGNTKADGNGDWILKLPSMPADKNPKDIEISENGKLDKTIKNVLVGEVWVGSGQSNMGWPMVGTTNFEEVKKSANYPMIRMFVQPGRAPSFKAQWDSFEGAQWDVVTPETIDGKSAVSFYFAKKISEELDVPVGMIDAQLSGTGMFVWIAREDMAGNEIFEKALASYNEKNAVYDYKKALDQWQIKYDALKKKKKEAKAQGKVLKALYPPKPFPEGIGTTRSIPGSLFNAKISPLLNYNIQGVIWYQGEAEPLNKGTPEKSNMVFQNKFSHLIEAWRKRWNKPDMPFYFVQLPGLGITPRDWAATRWSQYMTTKKTKNTDVVIAVDLGEEKNVHYKDKAPVGNRLALLALENTYKKNIVSHGPMFDSVKYDGNSCIVKYNTFGKKLILKGEPKLFEVFSGEKWIPASSVSVKEDGTITVNSDKEINGVRYLWVNWSVPSVCMFNEDGLPAMSFIDKKQ